MRAILIGATGLVGSEILKKLLSDGRFSKVLALTRHSTGLSHPKLQELIIDFEKPEEWSHEVNGDVLFSALGTTIKDAGTPDARYHVDHDYQLEVAKAAKANDVPRIILISSVGASKESKADYLRMKCIIEDDIAKLGFETAVFVRPGILDGQRKNMRIIERAAIVLLRLVPKIAGTEKLWPIKATEVARLCVKEAFDPRKGTYILEPQEIFAKLQ